MTNPHIIEAIARANAIAENLHVGDGILEEFEGWLDVWKEEADQYPTDTFESVEDFWDDLVEELGNQEVGPFEHFTAEEIYSCDTALDFYRSNDFECDEAFTEYGYSLKEFGTISDAIMLAVNAALDRRSREDLAYLQQALREA